MELAQKESCNSLYSENEIAGGSNFTGKKYSGKIYFPELDGLRFFAFLLVFIHHHRLFASISFLVPLNSFGWIGVDLFFVLSAFLFSKLLVAEYEKTRTINFRKFYIRRIFRIWPVYFVLIMVSVTAYLLVNHSIDSHIGIRILGLFTFSDNIMSAFDHFNPLPFVSHLWTIAYEEQFYIFIPFIILYAIRVNQKKRLIFLTIVIISFSLLRILLISLNVSHPAIWVLPVTHFESMVLGLIIGFGGFNFLLKLMNPLIIGSMGVVFFVLLCMLPPIFEISYWLILSYLLAGLSTSMILFSILSSRPLSAFFSKKLFVFLGKRSYGLYLFHLLSLDVVAYTLYRVPQLPSGLVLSFIYCLTFTIVVSIISYKFIETPFLKLKRRFEIIKSRPI
jgi:peptidoglycan/LPS O-acetylase OafA/YrhL